MGKYISKEPDQHGVIHYTTTEHQTWSKLINRQLGTIKNRASEDFIKGLSILELSFDGIPQLAEVNTRLLAASGWSVQQVAAIIRPIDFFNMLAEKKFPAATFIRIPEEIDYLQEPDIFHEIFGHCPMICNKDFSTFMMKYGQMAMNAPQQLHKLYARLFWFTVEFGLIKENNELRCYGGGILSSHQETIYALESTTPIREKFDLLNALRTTYRYDQIQQKYFYIECYSELFSLIDKNLEKTMEQAIELGDLSLQPKKENPSKDEWVTC